MFLVAMTKTVLKSLFSKPATRMYPTEIRAPFLQSRGSIQIKIEDCIFCGICQKKCPTKAIIVDKTKSNWSIDSLKCIVCNSCVEVCPKKCLKMAENYSASFSDKKESIKAHTKNA